MREEVKELLEQTLNVEVQDFKHMDMNEIVPEGNIPLICIYDNPADFPDKFVARLWVSGRDGGKPTRFMAIRDTLAQIRETIPPGMMPLSRNAIDDPVIVETWL